MRREADLPGAELRVAPLQRARDEGRAVQPTEATVQSIVPRVSVETGLSVTSGVMVQPSTVSGIESAPNVPS